MKLFISWSGQRSRQLAIALRDWFPMVLQFVEPWVSETDIGGGDRWALEIAKELEKSTFGIICLTRENIESPWILFEAGSLAKSLQDSKVVPLLLDLDFSEISGPLAQFQAKKVDGSSIRDIVRSVNQVAANSLDIQMLDKLFDVLWPQLEVQLEGIRTQLPHATPRRPPHEVLEELVSTVRTMDQRTRTVEETLQKLEASMTARIIDRVGNYFSSQREQEVQSLLRQFEDLIRQSSDKRKAPLPTTKRASLRDLLPESPASPDSSEPWDGFVNQKDLGSNE
jgi:hypothetical protein